MQVFVPFDATDPKTRLADVLSPDEREAFACAMLADVLAAVRAAGAAPTVVATADVAVDAPVRVDDRPLTPCVNALFDDCLPDEAAAVVMADLALATPEALARLFDAPGDVALAPGRGGGTNALVNRHPDFRADYHGASYLDHLRAARAAGASVAEVDSFRLATDVDEYADLADVLVHGEGETAAWLREAGFVLSRNEGRVTVDRR